MATINETVLLIQRGEVHYYEAIQQAFRPLIFSWLKKTHQLYTSEKEDLYSQALLILWECIIAFDVKKGVPFASYYKLSLYHWYGSYMQKKKPLPSCQTDYMSEQVEDDRVIETLIEKEQMAEVVRFVQTLSQDEQKLFHALLQEQSTKEIAEQMHLTKKTIQNKKYALVKKIRLQMAQEKERQPRGNRGSEPS